MLRRFVRGQRIGSPERGDRISRLFDPVEIGADDDQFEAQVTSAIGDRPMGRFGILDLAHETEHGHATFGVHRRERVESCEHRRGVGVVRVVHDRCTAG